MMKRILLLCSISLVSLVVFSNCESKPKKAAAANTTQEASWVSSMQGLSSEVQQLLPFVYSRQLQYSAKEQEVISERLKNFVKTAHGITPKMGEKFLGDDPMVQFSLDKLSADVTRANRALEAGQVKYAKGVMKNVMGHCFRCHSVTSVGSQAKWEVASFTGLSLSPVEKSELLVATRKYAEAIELLETSLKSPEYVMTQPFDYEAALKRYLVLTVRLAPDPRRAESLFETIVEMDSVPFYMSRKVDQWRQSLRMWSQEKAQKSKTPTYEEGLKLVQKARGHQSFQKDQSADVEYLRATGVLHQLLMGQKPANEKARVYALLGEVYEVLDELGYWGLHETYYEQCILVQPNTKISTQCFRRLQESIYLGYSGSSGVHIPEEEVLRLKELKAKAMLR